jgi:hypothetical protein
MFRVNHNGKGLGDADTIEGARRIVQSQPLAVRADPLGQLFRLLLAHRLDSEIKEWPVPRSIYRGRPRRNGTTSLRISVAESAPPRL